MEQQQQTPMQKAAAAADVRYLADNIRRYIDRLKPYTGDKKGLAPFIRSIEKITPLIGNLDFLDSALRFEQILGKLEGEATSILSEHPETWPQVRALLIRSFVEKRDVGDLLIELERIKFEVSIDQTFKLIQSALTNILDKVELSPVDPLREERIKSIKHRAFIHFRNILPEACISAIAGRSNICNIYQAIELLDEHKLMHLTHNRAHFLPNNSIDDNSNQYNDHYDNNQHNKYDHNSDEANEQLTSFSRNPSNSNQTNSDHNRVHEPINAINSYAFVSYTSPGGTRLPFIRVKGRHYFCKFLIDSGSNINMINPGRCSPGRRKIIPNQTVYSLSGTTTTNVACTFPIEEFDGQFCEFLEVKFNEKYDGLIGSQLLEDMGAVIDYRNRTITINSKTIPLEIDEEPSNEENLFSNEIVTEALCHFQVNHTQASEEGQSDHIVELSKAERTNASPCFEVTSKPINVFKNQFVFKLGTTPDISKTRVRRKNKVTFTTTAFTADYFISMIKAHFPSKGFVAVYFEDDEDFNLFQEAYHNTSFAKKPVKILKANIILSEFSSSTDMQVCILDHHLQLNHGGIGVLYKTLANKYYWPNFKTVINNIITRCTGCSKLTNVNVQTKKLSKNKEQPTNQLSPTNTDLDAIKEDENPGRIFIDNTEKELYRFKKNNKKKPNSFVRPNIGNQTAVNWTDLLNHQTP